MAMWGGYSPMSPPEYELWRERFRIVEWKGDAIYRTEKLDEGWWPEAEVKNNVPRKSNLLYAVGGPNAPAVAIRVKR